MSDLPPVDAKVKELGTLVDELQSELEVKSAQLNKLKSEHKSLSSKYVQLKKSYDSPIVSQTTVPDSLEHDSEVCDTIMYVTLYMGGSKATAGQ